ncbi:VOC family protein [Cohnella endophytica]|uniref:VOC family protein n=1 Tax=Cohnella endophytica TaxID=2419778 RepID=A0A494YD59_9BACL|nr:VOC family protein [Cohnella endophytica]RKP57945.1 VOC family protein [Cohnella endophytica]
MNGTFLSKLEHMQIPVKDLDESIIWYVSNLGFQLTGKSKENHHAFLTLEEGPMLMLWETKEDTNANFIFNGQSMPVLLYNTKQIHKLHDHLKSIGVEVPFYQDEGFGWVLKFIDLNGNMWGAIQYN